MTNFLLSRLMLHLKHIVTSTAKHDISHPDHFTDICWLASITSPMLYMFAQKSWFWSEIWWDDLTTISNLFWKFYNSIDLQLSSHNPRNMVTTRELKTTRGHSMPSDQHVHNGLTHSTCPVDESMLARDTQRDMVKT